MDTSPVGLFVSVGTIVIAAVVAAVMWLLRHKDTPWWLDTMCAVLLLVIAAIYLGMLYSIQSILPHATLQQRGLYADYQVALYIVPFFTAGIATNILSNVILHNHKYDHAMPLSQAAKRSGKALVLFVAILTVVGIPIYFAVRLVCTKGSLSIKALRSN